MSKTVGLLPFVKFALLTVRQRSSCGQPDAVERPLDPCEESCSGPGLVPTRSRSRKTSSSSMTDGSYALSARKSAAADVRGSSPSGGEEQGALLHP